jgi:hypothetical protein
MVHTQSMSSSIFFNQIGSAAAEAHRTMLSRKSTKHVAGMLCSTLLMRDQLGINSRSSNMHSYLDADCVVGSAQRIVSAALTPPGQHNHPKKHGFCGKNK